MRRLLTLLLLLSTGSFAQEAPPTVRVAVVGGPDRIGAWPALVQRAGLATGLSIRTVISAPKQVVVPVFRQGDADLLLIHGGDEVLALLAQGDAAPLRAWALNQHVIMGPADDPADVAGARDATEAMARIVRADAPLLLFRDPGSFALTEAAMRRAGVQAGPRQQLFNDAQPRRNVLLSAAREHAYVVVGHIPAVTGRMPNPDGLKVLLKGDPALRRVYVVVEPGPNHPADAARRARARRLADYLVSAQGQADLVAADREAGGPWLFPITPAARDGPAAAR
jgi:tungstate transport system substrate-binding protein